ncbi:MAG: nuclear transport factor 2 family protein [Pseudomonadota bacterium]
MGFAALIREMTAAACRGDGAGVAACFTPDGVYHDVFYGSFQGPAIAGMIEGYFHRDANNFRWDVHDPVEGDGVGYARYVFSFDSLIEGQEGTRGCFEGVAICRLRDGKIAEYHEVAETVAGLSMMGVSDARIARYADKKGKDLLARDEAAAHRQKGA